MTLNDLEPHEKLALAGLVRALIRMDGAVSPEEGSAVSKLAHQVGAKEFWALMGKAQESLPTPADVSEAAEKVIRREVRRWAYGELRRLADSDGVEVAEVALLEWLRRAWALD